jgi:hypothetical protein
MWTKQITNSARRSSTTPTRRSLKTVPDDTTASFEACAASHNCSTTLTRAENTQRPNARERARFLGPNGRTRSQGYCRSPSLRGKLISPFLLCKRYSLKDDALWHIRTERPLQHWSLPQKTSRQFQTNFGLLGPARLGRAVIMLLLQLELSFFITRCRGPTPSLLMLTVEGKDRPDFDQFAVPVWKKMRVESQQHHG